MLGSRVSSQINNNVAAGLRAADQYIAVRRYIDWVGPVADHPGYKARLTSVADPCPTRPSRRHVACFCKLEQALERCLPADIQTGPGERDQRSGADRPGRHMGRPARVAAMPGVLGGCALKISVWTVLQQCPNPRGCPSDRS